MTEKEMIAIAPNDYVVTVGSYSINVKQALRVTEKCFYYKDADGWRGGREIRQDRGSVVFAGPKDIAEPLHARLKASRDAQSEEEAKAYDRRKARDVKYIDNAERAKAALTQSQE